MADLAFVLTTVGFFALAGLLVRFSDRIVCRVETPAEEQPEQAQTPIRREAVR